MATEKKEFSVIFQLSKMRVFEVDYYTIGNNPHPYFATSSAEFVQNKRGYKRCGQCQNEIVNSPIAHAFWEKWDCKHLSDLTVKEYREMISDLEKLKERYNFIVKPLDKLPKPYHAYIPFSQVVELSKLTPKSK